MKAVATASGEQSLGVGQINKAMLSLNEVTQQNASASEELSSTAEELASQAESLLQSMNFFRVDEGEGRAEQDLASSPAPERRPAPVAHARHPRTPRAAAG